jgi:hypothetical protein
LAFLAFLKRSLQACSIIITFVAGIPPALLLYTPVLDDARYIVGAGADNRVALGALLEMILIIANVGTAVALVPDPQAAERRPLPWLCHRPPR